ncbi:MAG: DUF1328 domain-containing protein [Candidatus Spechtbacterales bacterium]
MGLIGWILTLFVVAVIAALLGFTRLAGTAAGIAKILFFLFVILFVGALLLQLFDA